MEAVSNLLQSSENGAYSSENGAYSEFSVENILQNLHEESKREALSLTPSKVTLDRENTENSSAETSHQSEARVECLGNNANDATEITPSSNYGSIENNQRIELQLCETKLWNSFHKYTNEMILTKSGRRMFPVIKVKINGLNPDGMYAVKMDFVPRDTRRWKFAAGKWTPCVKCENSNTSLSYTHPDSPNYGSHWMKSQIMFSKIKLSNKDNENTQVITLQSLHKYIPRIRVTRINNNEEEKTVIVHSFEQTEFIAVTAYQNDEITTLKIRHNPFAKAFLDTKLSGKKHRIDNSRVTMATQNFDYSNKSEQYDFYPSIPCNHHTLSHMQQRFYQYYPYYENNNDSYHMTHLQHFGSDFQPNVTSNNCRSFRMLPYSIPSRKLGDFDQSFVFPDRVVSPSVPYNFNTAMQYHI